MCVGVADIALGQTVVILTTISVSYRSHRLPGREHSGEERRAYCLRWGMRRPPDGGAGEVNRATHRVLLWVIAGKSTQRMDEVRED
jgi:hypothetical protein